MRAGCHRAAGVLLVVALGVIAGGCGGSSAPSRASYGKEVDRLCATLDDRVSAIQRKAPQTTDELVAFADDLQKALDEGVREVAEVERPDGDDGDKADAWISALTREKDQAIKPALTDLKKGAQTKVPAPLHRAFKFI